MNIKKYTFAALLALTGVAVYADTGIGPSATPDNVTVVYPQPDSRVDLGPNASPLGLQQISALFKRDVTVNPDCDSKACIYLEGEDTPLQSVGISGATVDLEQSKMGSVLFPHSCIANGRYRVTIPEGFWIVAGEKPSLSGAFDLYYEILVPQRISPAEGVAKELKEFRLEFPGYDEARLLYPKKIEFFRHSSSGSYPITVTEGKNEDGSPANYILITLNQDVTEQGDYSLFVKAGATAGIKYGENGEEITDSNIEAIYRYTVSQLDAPAITQPEGTVENLGPFELTVPEGADFWFLNDKAVSFIYPVKEDGSLAPDAAYRVTGRRVDETDRIAFTIWEGNQGKTSVTPGPGAYALQLASGLFSGSWGGEFINSAPFIYYYHVVGDPNEAEMIPTDNVTIRPLGIYTIDGKRIISGESGSKETLPEGLYIIDGRKTIIGK